VTEKKFPASYDDHTLEDLGRRLKEEREKACLTRSDVSSRTKISIDQISCLEEGRFGKMATVYARGFLRSYCELLRLDTEAILAEFKRLNHRHEEDNTKHIQHVHNNLRTGEPRSHAWTAAGLVFLLAGLLAAGLYLSPSLRATLAGLLPASVASRIGFLGSPAPPLAAAAPEAGAAPSPAEVETVATLVGAVPAPPEAFSGRLTLRAESPTWAQVTVDDQPVEHLLFEAGQFHSFEGVKLITVVCGDGRALRTEWNGQDGGLLGNEGPVEVFFNLGPGAPLPGGAPS
jgi:cytoskeletal protein RodZ